MTVMASSSERTVLELDHPLEVGYALPGYFVTRDPTRAARPGTVAFAARTPAGPMTARVSVSSGSRGQATIEVWGTGGTWMLSRVDRLVGAGDDPRALRFGHPVLDETNRRHPGARHGATGCVVDGLLARVLGQRVLSREAGRSWSALCRHLGDPAPGPFGLRLPPDPDRVAAMPTWWFHRQGIERQRAGVLVRIARQATTLAALADQPAADAYRRLRAIDGVGPWTANGVARVALGDPDAIIVGDYWIKHAVVSFFTDRARGTDDQMLELVQRWTGQRGRVERLVGLAGHRIERRAPGRPTPRIAVL